MGEGALTAVRSRGSYLGFTPVFLPCYLILGDILPVQGFTVMELWRWEAEELVGWAGEQN